MVSILNGTDYEFPKPQELKIRLKDILEGEVDEKYYLSKKMMNYITSNNEKWTGNNKKSIINKEIASAINTGEGTRRCDASNYVDNTLLENVDLKEVVRKYGIFDTVEAKHQAGSVYDKRGIAPTLDTMQGGYRQPCIEVVGKTRSGGERSLILDTEGISNCLTATDYKQPKQILIKNATKKGYLEATDGDGVYISAIDKKRGTVQKGMTPTIKTSVDVGVVVNDKTTISNTNDEAQQCNLLRVRKLTPKECWRLMGFSDETFEKAQKVNSNTQLYKQAGNSIVVNVLVQLFTNLLLNEKGSYFMKTKEMKLNIYRTDKMFDIEKLIKEEPELFDDLVKDYPLEEKIIMIEVAKKGA